MYCMVQILHYNEPVNTIYRDGKMKISVYADHAPVHFHVRTPGRRFSG